MLNGRAKSGLLLRLATLPLDKGQMATKDEYLLNKSISNSFNCCMRDNRCSSRIFDSISDEY